jgi:hypothetical protein
MKLNKTLGTLLTMTIACSLLNTAHASGGKTTTTDTSTTSNKSTTAGGGSGGGGGGGGGGSTSTTTKTAPTPISSATLTFSANSSGSCTGDYSILPYYPTLLDLVVNVSISGLNVPDGTLLYVNPVFTAGGVIYPYITSPMLVTGGVCSGSQHYFIYSGVGVAGVTISDGSGNILFAGN